MNGIIEPFEKFDVHPSSYIQGIGDAIGEWRRKALDNLRNLELNTNLNKLNNFEKFDVIFYIISFYIQVCLGMLLLKFKLLKTRKKLRTTLVGRSIKHFPKR